jgi:acetate kinase
MLSRQLARDSFRHRIGAIALPALTAKLAIDVFCYSVRKQIAAVAAAMGGVDLLVFTGGIGEHDAEACKAICDELHWLGNAEVKVLPAREDTEIARHTARIAFSIQNR